MKQSLIQHNYGHFVFATKTIACVLISMVPVCQICNGNVRTLPKHIQLEVLAQITSPFRRTRFAARGLRNVNPAGQGGELPDAVFAAMLEG